MHVCERCGLREMTDVCSDLCVVCCICLVSRPVSYVYYLYLQLNMQCTLVGRPVHRTGPHRSSVIAPHRSSDIAARTRLRYLSRLPSII